MPWREHLEAALHIMGYLKLRHNFKLVFDLSYPNIDYINFWKCDWTNFYEGAVEAILPNAQHGGGSYPTQCTTLRGKEVDLWIFIDSNHAGNKQTRRLRSRFRIYMNILLTKWYSKEQSIIETSVFGAEFVTMKVRVETLYAIQYKLRMMDIPISGALFMEITCCLSIAPQNLSQHLRKSGCNSLSCHPWVCVTGHKQKHLVSWVVYDINDGDTY